MFHGNLRPFQLFFQRKIHHTELNCRPRPGQASSQRGRKRCTWFQPLATSPSPSRLPVRSMLFDDLEKDFGRLWSFSLSLIIFVSLPCVAATRCSHRAKWYDCRHVDSQLRSSCIRNSLVMEGCAHCATRPAAPPGVLADTPRTRRAIQLSPVTWRRKKRTLYQRPARNVGNEGQDAITWHLGESTMMLCRIL